MNLKEDAVDQYPRLVKPSIEYMDSYIAACREYSEAGLNIYDEFKGTKPDSDAIESLLKRFEDHSNGIGLPEGWVPSTTFWLVDKDEYIGGGNIRHTLTDLLKKFGGHIGYEIRPSKWRQGYGTLQLKLLLAEAALLGIKSALLTCAVTNLASVRVIEENGGVLMDCINIEIGSYNRPTYRYMIDTWKSKNSLKLVFPAIDHKESALAYRQEYFDKGEMIIHGDGGLDEAENYEQWIGKINADLEKNGGGFVPATTYFAFVGDKIVGTIQIRHRLNEYLLKYGGHIGYGIVPSERRKGYATEMLQLALKKCKSLGIEKALVTCDKNNFASAGTILKNKGVLEDEVTDDKGSIIQRYWIEIT